MLAPQQVLARYPAPVRGSLVPLGNHGGFSGAELWQVDAVGGAFCLKKWPVDWRSAADLAWIHALLDRASALPWMPRVIRTIDGDSSVREQDRLWDLQTWMPGAADFRHNPTTTRLEAACAALAQVHQTWADKAPPFTVCPAIVRRRDAWQAWRQLVQSGWRPQFAAVDPLSSVAEELWRRVSIRADDLHFLVTPWLSTSVAVQPCICDLWHDHVFFRGDQVTGFIDFGSARIDNVAVDLARLLGSLVGADDAKWQIGLAAYERIRPLSATERTLARDLDRSGTILAAAQWLRWLYHKKRRYLNIDAVRERLEAIARGVGGSPALPGQETYP